MDAALVDNLVRFEQALRLSGLRRSGGRMPDAVSALIAVGVASRGDVRAALRSVLVNRREDLALFDRLFDLFWRSRHEPFTGPAITSLGERPRVTSRPTPAAHLDFDDDEGAPASAASLLVGAYSAEDVPRWKDFADFTPADLERAAALFDRLDWRLGVRRARRWRAARNGMIDLRRAVAERRTSGELVRLPRRRRIVKPRPLIVIADVSGSMERYSRVLLQFVYAVTRGSHRVDSFVFATRLTRLPRTTLQRRGGAAADRLVRSVQDWGGGTRIGDVLRAFNVQWARRVMRNGPVVLLISDGWDRGDPEALVRELARVRRACRRLIWLNPLLGSSDYEPLTRGMMAALPLVDDFLPVHNLESLQKLAVHLQALWPS